ncbi:hypothetical protein [Kribbella sp. NPDC051770]|uniref:hypothetical protein n=1 Tax=Kribbella sp. NPDC051770 TaxID=3155413 RepID=UPI00342DD9A9
MASNLDCLGLGVDSPEAFADLVDRIGPRAAVVGRAEDGLEVRRWEDPSGARLVLVVGERGILRVTPSFGGERVVQLGDLQRAGSEAAVADVVDGGETVTRLAIELEELALLGEGKHAGLACVVGLAPEVRIFPDAEAFAGSEASLLSDGDPGPRPEHYEADWVWPPRMAAESFIPSGMFGGEVQPLAAVNGRVRYAERRTTMLTGQDFVVARVVTAGFEADVCFPAEVAAPLPGAIVSANVFLTGSFELEVPEPRRRWFKRR